MRVAELVDVPERWFWVDGERYRWYYPHEMVAQDEDLSDIATRGEAEKSRAFWFAFANGGICTYDPGELEGWPLGQMHCPVCGQMVICGESIHINYGRNEMQVCSFMDEYDEVKRLRDPQRYDIAEMIDMGATTEDVRELYGEVDLSEWAEKLERNDAYAPEEYERNGRDFLGEP